jgi:sulfur carrier protein
MTVHPPHQPTSSAGATPSTGAGDRTAGTPAGPRQTQRVVEAAPDTAPPAIEVTINQQPHRLPAGATLADAIERIGIRPPFAAAVNLQFVPRTRHARHRLAAGDQIELIAPITGG